MKRISESLFQSELAQIIQRLQSYAPQKVILFGSFARGDYHAHCRQLDQYYIPTRYPNSVPDGIPHEVYTAAQAVHAVEMAQAIIAFVTGRESLSTMDHEDN